MVLFFALGIQQLQSSSVVKMQQSRELNHKILKWLSPLDFRQRQQDVLSFRSPGTVNWLLEDNSYISWVAAGKNETLWLHGAPGTGKTVVASIAIDHLRKINNGNRFAVSFVFCDYKDEALQTPENMISAIIKEIVRNRPVSAGLEDFYKSHEESGVRPTLSELEQLLRSEAARLTSVYVVVDAVDELADKDSSREKFLDALSAGMPYLNVLFTSRPHIKPHRARARLSRYPDRAKVRNGGLGTSSCRFYKHNMTASICFCEARAGRSNEGWTTSAGL